MPSLLILQLKRIGDAVLTAPVLGALRAAWPDARITLVLAGAAAQLGPLFASADEVLTWQPGRLNLSLLARLRELRADAVLDFTGTDRSAFLSLMSGAPLRAGYEKFAEGFLRRRAWPLTSHAVVRELHTIDFHHTLPVAAGLTLPSVPDAGHLTLPPGLVLPALPDNYVLVHPGTAREEKFWPAGHWQRLLDQLYQQHGIPLVITGGDWSYERRHIAEILAGTTAPMLDLRGKLSLGQLAGVMAKARLAITVDTAAMHLAAAFQVPQVAMFGPTNPYHWAPRHSMAVVLQSGAAEGAPLHPRQAGAPMAGLPWQTAAAAAERLLANSTASS